MIQSDKKIDVRDFGDTSDTGNIDYKDVLDGMNDVDKIDEFFDDGYSVYGYCQKAQPYNPFHIGRMLPMLCWMNVPMLQREGAKYFDPERTYGLLPGGKQIRNNWYDTGAPLLEDILSKRPRLKGYHRDIREFVEHFGSGSWQNNSLDAHKAWLEQHKDLWL
mgnify:CR=1 FL=1